MGKPEIDTKYVTKLFIDKANSKDAKVEDIMRLEELIERLLCHYCKNYNFHGSSKFYENSKFVEFIYQLHNKCVEYLENAFKNRKKISCYRKIQNIFKMLDLSTVNLCDKTAIRYGTYDYKKEYWNTYSLSVGDIIEEFKSYWKPIIEKIDKHILCTVECEPNQRILDYKLGNVMKIYIKELIENQIKSIPYEEIAVDLMKIRLENEKFYPFKKP